MESIDTIDADNGNSATNQESLPTTTAVLDKSKSLFGSSTTTLTAPARDSTPDESVVEPREACSSSVNIESNEKHPSTDETVSDEKKEESTSEYSAVNTTESLNTPDSPHRSEGASPRQMEESPEKNVVAVDTSEAATRQSSEPGADNHEPLRESESDKEDEDGEVGEISENDDVGGEEVSVEDEEEEEVPKKKAKRTVSTSEEGEEQSDPISSSSGDGDEPATASVRVEEPESSSPVGKVESRSETPLVPVEDESHADELNTGQSSPNLEIDEKIEDEDVRELSPDSHQDAEAANDGIRNPEDSNVTPEQTQEPNTSVRSSSRRKATTVSSTPSTSTPKRGGRGRRSVVDAQEGEAEGEKAQTPLRDRSSKRAKNNEIQEEQTESEDCSMKNNEEEEISESSRRGRSRRSVIVNNAEDDGGVEAHTSEEPAEETPKRGGRAKRSVASSSTVLPTPRSTRAKGKKSEANEEVSGEPVEPAETTESVEVEDGAASKTSGRSKARKSTAKTPTDDGDVPDDEAKTPTSSRRSTRTKATPKSVTDTPVTESKRTPSRGRKQKTSIGEEEIDEVPSASEPTMKKGRSSAKNTPSSSKKVDEYDPYDMETEMEHHPEPLKNIHMEMQNFGTVKYAKSGQSESKYFMTEKSAESKVSGLQSSPSAKNKRSLADMTPGKDKAKQRSSAGTGRRSKSKKEELPENDVDMVDVSQTDSPEATTPSIRGRKRKSEVSDLTPSAKREPQVVLKDLTSEEQLQVDHPQDDSDPCSPGARVYALFQKTFYAAVVLSERDGLGRYKVQFTTDKLVKDVPNSGIIPLRVLRSGKTAIYDEQYARVEAGPNDISAEEWAKGIVTITVLDDDGEPLDEVKTVDWKELSFDLHEWREFVKNTEQNATAIVTSNITTMSQTSRTRKPQHQPLQHPTKQVNRRKKAANSVMSHETSPAPVDEDELLPMKQESVGKNIFSGKVFMLTSANRSNSSNVPSMFKKKNLMDFIMQNGGIITEQHNSFEERHSDLEPLLISDTYYRTHKYLAALARGIPCVNNLWLKACGEEGKCVDYSPYILPAGASIFDDSRDMPAPKNPSELLKGTTIYIHSTHSVREITQTGPGGTFIEIWRPILELLGANVMVGEWEKIIADEVKFDVALVDGTFRDEIMNYSDEIGASKVTSEWIIQTIILGKAPVPTAHSKFDPYRLHHRTQ